MPRQELEQRLAGPNTLLNLSWSIRDQLVERFDGVAIAVLIPARSISGGLGLEVGQSFHHVFWTIGLALNEPRFVLKELARRLSLGKDPFRADGQRMLRHFMRVKGENFSSYKNTHRSGGVQKMQTRKLGNRNLEVSAIRLGYMGMSFGYGAAKDEQEMVSMFRSDLDVTFFDTVEITARLRTRKWWARRSRPS
jgi:hypothetical protein